jgi:DNA segregation ATPase FtsK/SpoIIIE, S-DNA-T family
MAVTRDHTSPFTEPPDLSPIPPKKKRWRFFEYTQTSSRSSKSSPKSAPRAHTSKFLGFKVKMKPLTQDKKLDFGGVLITFVGLLAFLALVSPAKGNVAIGLVDFFYQLAGVGAFLIPIAFFVVGMWVLFRSWDRLPHFTTARLVGIILLLFNIFTLIYFIAGPVFSGVIGALFGSVIMQGLGPLGAITVWIAWLLVALAITLDLSLPDLVRAFTHAGDDFIDWWKARRAPRSDKMRAQSSRSVAPPPAAAPFTELTDDFTPLSPTYHPRAASSAKAATPSHIAKPSALAAISNPAPAADTPWALPSVENILDPASPVFIRAGVDKERAQVIEQTLASFGVPVHVVDIQRGPTVTQFGVEPDFIETRQGRTRVRVSQIVRLTDDLALALAAPRIRIQAPVPGHMYVGIEVPNPEISLVSLKELLDSEAFKKLRSPLRFALGKDVAGRAAACDLAAMPHLMIAGTTGSGKSVCVNAILSCLLLNNTPAEMRLVLVDPKRVELTAYNGIPHLLAPVITETEKVIGALQWVIREMDSRFRKFAESGVRDIKAYNAKTNPHLPYLVVVIDELADLMMLAAEETERSLTRLAQLARATGIHLIIATQRPSVDVITGLIKANFPARIAFAVASNTDSRVILDQPGAERLLGRGDMLFQAPDAPAPVRLQGAYVSDQEINRLVDTWRLMASSFGSADTTGATVEPISLQPQGPPLSQGSLWDSSSGANEDPLLKDAISLVRREGRASISMLQRRMRVGYTRSARLIDAMEEQHIISGPLPNSQVREILDFGQQVPASDK